MAYRIDSVEDDQDIARIIHLTLEKQGYSVKTFYDGTSFFKDFASDKPNLVLLDLMLPDMDGFDIIRQIRADKANDPIQIMVVSAKSQVIDKVDGLDLGADDYLEKPFDILELLSRVNAKYRRYAERQVLQIGEVILDKSKRTCLVHGKDIPLTNAEFVILSALMSRPDEVVTREELLRQLWGGDKAYESRTIDVHIKSLRTKLQDEGKHIYSVYGVGYRYLK